MIAQRLSLGALLVVSLSALSACAADVNQPGDGDGDGDGDEEEAVGVDAEELTVCATGSTLKGVDVSHHNGTVNWARVKSSGRTFAFARVSDGINTPDTKFAQNWPAIKQAGLVRGVYQFFRPSRDPVQQADLMLSRIHAAGGLKAGDLPPVLDLEVTDGMTKAVVVARAKKWLDRVQQKTGVKPIIYTGNNMAPTIGNNFSSYALWIPHYGVTCPRLPAAWTKWSFWQDSESGSVPGITSSGTDTNHFNGTRTQLNAMTLRANVMLTLDDLSEYEAARDESILDNTEAMTTDAAMGTSHH